MTANLTLTRRSTALALVMGLTSALLSVGTAQALVTVPGAPSGLSAAAGNGQVVLSWTAPGDDGGAALTDYVVEFSSGGAWSTFADGTSTATSATVTGLTNGTEYTFRVRATNSAGTGAVSSTAAATSAAAVPGAPSGLSAIAGKGQVALSWTAPSDDGGAAITDYVIEVSSGGSWSTITDETSTSTSATVTGLTNGTGYTFRVKAANSAGTGAVSSSAAVTPAAAVPGTPSGLSATPDNGRVALSWTAPSDDGGAALTDYVIEQSDDAGSTWPALSHRTSASTSATITGLTNGTEYTFRVKATNSAGTGPTSGTAAATPAATVPGAPSELATTPGQGQVALSWTAPDDIGGAAITDYEVEASSGGAWSTFTDEISASTSATVTGLTNGTEYTFRVTAINSVGTGPASGTAAATPAATVPGAPSELSATPGDGQVALSWTAPDDIGGAAITDYEVEVSSGGAWSTFTDGTSASTSTTVTGLTNGTEYTFKVKATNSAGTGPTWGSAAATPATVPGAPSELAATPGQGQVALSWTAPDDIGGAAITDYEIEHSDDAGSTWSTFSYGTSASTSETVTRLTNGTEYTFRVKATNSAGTSQVSGTATATPGVTATVAGLLQDLTIEITLELDADLRPEDSKALVTVTNVPATATVIIEVRSEPVILGVVSPDEDGNVIFSAPMPPLQDGQHDLVVTVQNDDGELKTSSVPFFVDNELLVSQPTTDRNTRRMMLYTWLLVLVGAIAVVLVLRRSGIFERY